MYLPEASEWYSFYNSEYQEPGDSVKDIYIEQEEIGIYVKAGSIIPRKYVRRMSALETLKDNYLLDIFLPRNGGRCTGHLYFDDGESLEYRTIYSLVEIVFEDYSLSIKVHHDTYREGQSFVVDEINVFGVDREPSFVS